MSCGHLCAGYWFWSEDKHVPKFVHVAGWCDKVVGIIGGFLEGVVVESQFHVLCKTTATGMSNKNKFESARGPRADFFFFFGGGGVPLCGRSLRQTFGSHSWGEQGRNLLWEKLYPAHLHLQASE